MKLSHSSHDLYQLCPRRWKFKYIDKWRSPVLRSPLFFGGALDEAFSHILCTKKVNLTEDELTLQLTKTAEEVFQDKMITVPDIFGQPVQLAKSLDADYFTSDFTPELLKPQHEKLLQELEPAYKLVDFLDFHKSCKEQLAAKRKLYNDDQILYNYMTWLTLVEKGLIIVQEYRKTILPQISEVVDIQKRISLPNADGDEITGLIDFTARFVDTGADLYICDNKTSSKPYSPDSVKESAQLSTYCEAEGVKTAAYIVAEKKLFKKQPNIRISVIKDVISEATFDKTFDNFEKMVYNVQSENFPANEEACFSFGKRCEYFGLCKHGSVAGLVKKGE